MRKYRIKIEQMLDGSNRYYPQYKDGWIWRSIRYRSSGQLRVHTTLGAAIAYINEHKEMHESTVVVDSAFIDL